MVLPFPGKACGLQGLKMQGGVESATPEPIYGNCTEGGFRGPVGFKGFIERLKFSGSKNSTKLIKKLEKSEYPVKYLVYDASLPWVLSRATRVEEGKDFGFNLFNPSIMNWFNDKSVYQNL